MTNASLALQAVAPPAELSRDARALRIIRDLGQGLLDSLALPEIFESLLSGIERHFGVGHTYLLAPTQAPDGDALEVVAAHGAASSQVGRQVQFGVGLAGVAAQRRRTVRIGNVRASRRYLTAMTSGTPGLRTVDLPGLPDADSQLAIPFVAGDELMAVLVAESLDAAVFSTEDAETFSLLSSQIAAAVRNARSAARLEAAHAEELRLRQASEHALHELAVRESHLRALLRTIPDPVWMKDAAGAFLLCNATFERFCGVPEAQLRGQVTHDPAGSDDAKAFAASDQSVLQTGIPLTQEEPLHFAFGADSGVYETVRVPVLTGDGGVGGVLGVARNVTERKALHDALEAAKAAAETAAQAKSDFLANMSHEIRTPMNAILGLVGLALRTDLTGQQYDYLEKVQGAAQSLLGILNDILDLSKIEAGKMELESVPFELDEVLDGLATVFAVPVERKGLELLFARNPDVPGELIGDPLRLGQVLTNLVGNAVKFTERGDIVLSIDVVTRTNDAVRLRVSVRDTGIGMTREQAGRLFRSFSQADTSTSRRYGGTGLGLAISKQLVERMAGRIWVDSEPGVGSTFSFEAEFGVAAQREVGAPPAIDVRGLRVLVVDDNAAVREVLCAHLQAMSFRVESAGTVDEALDRLRTQDPNDHVRLVLIDQRMPDMDGLMAARVIKRHLGLHTTPPVLLLAAPSSDLAQWGDEDAIDGVLRKPVNASDLLDTVMRVFGAKDAAPRHSLRRSPSSAPDVRSIRGARILLAEDNDINRQVAVELLESAGLVVDVAVDGVQAIAALQRAEYACVLMDVQMPVMDGYTATRRIREEPRWDKLPIIAMTANVMQQDRDAAAAAGMVDHIGKPIDPHHLFGTLLRWIAPTHTPVDATPPLAPASAPVLEPLPVIAGLDTQAGLHRVAGNHKLYVRLLRALREDHADDVQQMVARLQAGECAEAERMAHTFKGIVGTLGAMAIAQVAGGLELALRRGNVEEAQTLVGELAELFAPLLEGLLAWDPAEQAEPTGPTRSPADLLVMLDALVLLLEESDAEAADKSGEFARSVPPGPMRVTADSMWRHAEAFDYAEALDELRDLRTRLVASSTQA